MPEKTTTPVHHTIRHPKTADKDLTRFRRVLGSIALRGPVPSKKFLDGVEERPDRRARRVDELSLWNDQIYGHR